MKGALVKYKSLGELMRGGRELAGMDLNAAAMALGLTNKSYLSRCELGECNFPFSKIKRACQMYRIPIASAVEAIVDDYRAGMKKALGTK